MQFIVEFTDLGYDESIKTTRLHIEAESAAAIHSTVTAAAICAELEREAYFDFCGHRLAVHNFTSVMQPKMWDYLELLCRKKSAKLPYTKVVKGRRFQFTEISVLPLAEWFARDARVLPPTAE